jgi:hypothetical protein
MSYIKNTILALFSLGSILCFSQDERLFQNEWYVTELNEGDNTLINPTLEVGSSFTIEFQNENMLATACLTNYCEVTIDATSIAARGFGCSPPLVFCGSASDMIAERTYFNIISGFPLSYTIVEDGEEAVLTITNSNGDTAVFSNRVLSTGDFKTKSAFSLYPNPLNNVLNISTVNGKSYKFTIYDATGKIMLTKEINTAFKAKVDVKHLPSGMYFAKLTTNGVSVYNKKLVKN